MTDNKELLEIIETTVKHDSVLHRQMIDVLKAYKDKGEESVKYLWGQRVIIDNQTIGIFRHYEDNRLWVELPDGVIQWRYGESVKPLPGGQL